MRVYASVDKNALTKNMNEIRKKVGDNIKIMPVIKADAYGHNAAQTAKALDRYADYFAVAVIEEAVSLRQNGIAKHVLYDEPQAAIPASLLQLLQNVRFCTCKSIAEGLF